MIEENVLKIHAFDEIGWCAERLKNDVLIEGCEVSSQSLVIRGLHDVLDEEVSGGDFKLKQIRSEDFKSILTVVLRWRKDQDFDKRVADVLINFNVDFIAKK